MDGCENVVSRFGPSEGLWVCTVMADESHHVGALGVDTAINAAPDLFVGDASEEAFDLVEPGGAGWREMDMPARSQAPQSIRGGGGCATSSTEDTDNIRTAVHCSKMKPPRRRPPPLQRLRHHSPVDKHHDTLRRDTLWRRRDRLRLDMLRRPDRPLRRDMPRLRDTPLHRRDMLPRRPAALPRHQLRHTRFREQQPQPRI